jgi:HAD superfamily hydrolase (TIGR01509 family)
MSSPEWSRYLADELGVPGTPEQINADVVARMIERYGQAPPLIPGAVEAVKAVAGRWPVAIASSSNRELIEVVLRAALLVDEVREVVSSEEVPRGKPAPDVYLEAARRLHVEPSHCVAVEDSHNGIRSARAAGMIVFAIPNPHFPPDEEAMSQADEVLRSIAELTPEVIERII